MKRSGHRLYHQLCGVRGCSLGEVLGILADCRHNAVTSLAAARLLDLEVAFLDHVAELYRRAS
jgi:hypothetical protein